MDISRIKSVFRVFSELYIGPHRRLLATKHLHMHVHFLDVPMPWRSIAITHVRRRSFAELLAHGGAALAMPRCVHRESIGMLQKPRGTVAYRTKMHLIYLLYERVWLATLQSGRYDHSSIPRYSYVGLAMEAVLFLQFQLKRYVTFC